MEKFGIIAGNGEFPFFVAQRCKEEGLLPVIAAIKGETEAEIEDLAHSILWLGVGQLGKLIRYFKSKNVKRAIMAGQVKHVRIFGKDHPDLRMLHLLSKLPQRNTDSILSAIADELEKEDIHLEDSTLLLKNMVPKEGILTKRSPEKDEWDDIRYGWKIARHVAGLDLGQTVVVRNRAIIAVEAMEGTDATIERASFLSKGKPIRVIKVSKPSQDMRFDVPVMGLKTLGILRKCNVSTIAIDAGKSLIFHKDEVINLANKSNISIVALNEESEWLKKIKQ